MSVYGSTGKMRPTNPPAGLGCQSIDHAFATRPVLALFARNFSGNGRDKRIKQQAAHNDKGPSAHHEANPTREKRHTVDNANA